MNLKQLRIDAPTWEWKAIRDGFGWNYIGKKDNKIVNLSPCSQLISEDDFTTVWMVSDGKITENYNIWIFSNYG